MQKAIDGELLPSVYNGTALQEQCGPQCSLKKLCRLPYTHNDSYEQGLKPIGNQSSQIQHGRTLYTTLLPWQTRLLRILPGDTSDLLRCELLIADLVCFPGVGLVSTGEIVQFSALSYCWGSTSKLVSIECNKEVVCISRNLAEALLHLRNRDEARLLWADGLCINQNDPSEKSAQVRIMFPIYQKSQEVVAWLGVPVDGEIPVLDMIPQIAQLVDGGKTMDQAHDAACKQLLPMIGQGLARLLSRPWFARTWVRQEVFAHGRVILLYGSSHATLEDLYAGLSALQDLEDASLPCGSFKQEPNYICLQVMRLSKGGPGTSVKKEAPPGPISHGIWLSELLSGCRFGVTDNRDRVYGSIGILQAKTNDWLKAYCTNPVLPGADLPPIDYTRSTVVVYQDVVRFLINRHESLLPLFVFQRRASPDSTASTWALNLDQDTVRWYLATHLPQVNMNKLLPSNMRRSREVLKGVLKGILHDTSSLHQWMSFQGRFRPPPSPYDSSPILRLPGFLVGRVGSLVLQDEEFHDLSFGTGLQRSPISADVVFSSKKTKGEKLLQVRTLGVTEATVKTLIEECDQKVMDLILDQDPMQTAESKPVTLCTRLLVSWQAMPGDCVVLLHGGTLPVILRSSWVDGRQHYNFLGPAIWLTLSPEKDPGVSFGKAVDRGGNLLTRASTQYSLYCDRIDAIHSLETEFALL